MPNNRCLICRRRLKNRFSVKIGIGPVCRAIDSLQREFDFMNARIKLLKHERGKYVFICDIGHTYVRSITSDAEYVVGMLYDEYEITDETRIFYKDSDGDIDELIHTGNRFTGFKRGHDGVDLGYNIGEMPNP